MVTPFHLEERESLNTSSFLDNWVPWFSLYMNLVNPFTVYNSVPITLPRHYQKANTHIKSETKHIYDLTE